MNRKSLYAFLVIAALMATMIVATSVTRSASGIEPSTTPARNPAATPPQTGWSMTYGGTGDDMLYSTQQTSDGGYIAAGSTTSFAVYQLDFYLLKTDSAGELQWNRTYGDVLVDVAHSVQQTLEGGYILAGSVSSRSQQGFDYNAWLLKTDGNGSIQWDNSYWYVDCASTQQTSDNGYILAGSTSPNWGSITDAWLLKTDDDGNYQWSKSYGGTDNDAARSVQQTTDGGYILAGYTSSFGAGQQDFWLLKTNSTGGQEWNKTYGGTDYEEATFVQQTSDGGYIITGPTLSFGAGGYDFWLVKTDSNGSKQWSKTYGGALEDAPYCVRQTTDGGYILAGYTCSFGAGLSDFLIVKTDAYGNEQQSRTYGGTDFDYAYSVQQTSDGGYILGGCTRSFGAGGFDIWLLKIRAADMEPEAGTWLPTEVIILVGEVALGVGAAVLAIMARKRHIDRRDQSVIRRRKPFEATMYSARRDIYGDTAAAKPKRGCDNAI